MLQFLVTSAARRRLLLLLWGELEQGSVAQLADRAGVSFASAYRELKAMRRLQMVRTSRRGGDVVYRANEEHPNANLLRDLAGASSPPASSDGEFRDVRRRLKALGAPLDAEPADAAEVPTEATLAEGVRLARRDPTVARVLPLCFWTARDKLRWRELASEATGAEDKHALGFFLDLTGELAGDPRFAVWAELFRDRRVRAQRDFFETPPTRRSRRLAESRSPDLARKWGFRMNMEMGSFRSMFEKFAGLRD